MDSFTLYRDKIGETLTNRLADAIGEEIVSLEEGSIIARKILDGVRGARDHKELVDFIEELAHEWTLFGPVLVMEQAQKIEEQEETAIHQVSDLLKENRIDEAVAAAEHATQESSIQSTPFQENQDPQPQEVQPLPEAPNQSLPIDTLPPPPPMPNDPAPPQQIGGTT